MTDPLDTSIEGMAQNGDGEEQETLFALEGDRPLTGAGLVKRGLPIEAEVSLMSASVPCRGLLDPEKIGKLIVTFEPSGYVFKPQRDRANDSITGWTLRMQVRPVYVEALTEVLAEDIEPTA